MTELDEWLKRATRHLSQDSANQVRREIGEHYEIAREVSINGATAADADRAATAALGDAKEANRQYRKVLLTSTEAKQLREGNREARVFCSRAWIKAVILAVPAATLLAAGILFLTGATLGARAALMGALTMGVLFAGPLLPIYTLARGRFFRVVKWVLLVGMPVLILGTDAFKWSWLLATSLWPLVWNEWIRFSIRRKLRVADWPKQLYL